MSNQIVTCIGDSETYCYGLARTDSWPYQLGYSLGNSMGIGQTLDTLSPWSGTGGTTGAQREHVGTAWTIRNAGISGDTSRGMRARWATDVLGPAVLPDYCIIMVGENDIYYAAPSGGNDPTYDLNYASTGLKANVSWMVASCLSNGIIPILATPTPHGTLETVSDRWTRMQDWLKWLGTSMTWMSTSETANTLGCALSDHYQAVYDVAQPAYPRYYPSGLTYSIDNIHPSAAGCLVIAGIARTAILSSPARTAAFTKPVTFGMTIAATPGIQRFDLGADFLPITGSFDLASDFIDPYQRAAFTKPVTFDFQITTQNPTEAPAYWRRRRSLV